jgi:hypothetical protein
MTTSVLPVPDELRACGRACDPNFDPQENLFLRFQNQAGGRIEPTDVRCPDQSVNRGKYSKPEWVLLPSFPEWGIGCIKVADVPTRLLKGDGTPVHFQVEHDPQEDNYAHSEIRAYADFTLQDRLRKIKSNPLKLTFRTILSQKATILKYPAS